MPYKMTCRKCNNTWSADAVETTCPKCSITGSTIIGFAFYESKLPEADSRSVVPPSSGTRDDVAGVRRDSRTVVHDRLPLRDESDTIPPVQDDISPG